MRPSARAWRALDRQPRRRRHQDRTQSDRRQPVRRHGVGSHRSGHPSLISRSMRRSRRTETGVSFDCAGHVGPLGTAPWTETR
jgi:hypothetical protein